MATKAALVLSVVGMDVVDFTGGSAFLVALLVGALVALLQDREAAHGR